MVTNVLQGGDVIQVAAITQTFTTPLYVQPSITEIAQLKGQKVGVSRIGAVSHLSNTELLFIAGPDAGVAQAAARAAAAATGGALPAAA